MTPAIDLHAQRRARARAASAGKGPSPLAAEVGGRLDERLSLMKIEPRRILDAGSGAGAGLAGLRRRYPASEVIALDDVTAELTALRDGPGRAGAMQRFGAMLGLARRSPLALAADMAKLPFAAASMGLVWSNLALQRVTDPLPSMRELSRVVEPGGLLIFSTLGPDTLKELRRAFAVADPGQPHVHDLLDMHDLGDMLVESGFTAPVMEMETLNLTYENVMALARDLRAMGAVNALVSRRRGLSGRALWERLHAASVLVEGRLPASFEIVYGHAWKPQPRPAVAQQVVKFYPVWERKT